MSLPGPLKVECPKRKFYGRESQFSKIACPNQKILEAYNETKVRQKLYWEVVYFRNSVIQSANKIEQV